MMGFPGTAWGEPPNEPLSHAPLKRNWERCDGEIRHVFTHFELRLTVYRAETQAQDAGGIWAPLLDIKSSALPTVMSKVLALAKK
jgi:A/G-specific adenine glycosylase